jgi:hypothetical protein
MLEVVDAVVAARSECTENDPSGARGWRGWQMGTRRKRELHIGYDEWEKDDTDQIASIVNSRLGIRFVVCNTDVGTCIEGLTPRNRSQKGAATDRAIEESQGTLFGDAPEPHPDSVVRLPQQDEPKQPIRTYHLCVYHEGDDIRAELSCFTESSGGFFSDWAERIFIVGGEAGPAEPAKRRKSDDDDGSDFDIPVKRKK